MASRLHGSPRTSRAMWCNNGWMRLTQKLDWQVEGLAGLERRNWYLLIANHQSWADIFVLQYLFGRRIPMPKFFLKQELIWVPLIGLCWWALDFPFMKRHSKEYLARHPEKRGSDFETTRRACERSGAPGDHYQLRRGHALHRLQTRSPAVPIPPPAAAARRRRRLCRRRDGRPHARTAGRHHRLPRRHPSGILGPAVGQGGTVVVRCEPLEIPRRSSVARSSTRTKTIAWASSSG